jgi:hypothetical protein
MEQASWRGIWGVEKDAINCPNPSSTSPIGAHATLHGRD